MDFEDSPQEASFRHRVRQWLEAEAPAHVVSGWKIGTGSYLAELVPPARAWQAKKAAAGYGAIAWPVEHGGLGASPMEAVIFRQEEAKWELPVGLYGIGMGMCLPTVMAHGTPEQRERYLRPGLFGDEIWCQLFSEPAAGSDSAGVRARAVRDGDDWIVSGQKVWTTGAQVADFGILLVRTDPSVPKHKGLTMFIANMRAPGVEVRGIRQISGSSTFNEVFFNDVRIPDSDRLDAVGKGWTVAMTTLMNERLAIAQSEAYQGVDVDALIALARGVETETGTAIQDAAVRERIADWHITSMGQRFTLFRTLTSLSKGEIPGPENSVGKIVKGKRSQDLTAFAMELQGIAGILMDSSVPGVNKAFQDAHLYAPSTRIAGGTDEILRNIVAERVLGLPADIRVDKDVPFQDLAQGR